MWVNALLSYGPNHVRQSVVIWVRAGGSQGDSEWEKSQPVPNSALSPLCCCCMELVSSQSFPLMFLAVCERGERQASRVQISQRLPGKSCWLTSFPLVDVCDWPFLSWLGPWCRWPAPACHVAADGEKVHPSATLSGSGHREVKEFDTFRILTLF